MQTLTKRIAGFVVVVMFILSCTTEQYQYELDDVQVVLEGPEKDKEKTVQQYLNILYANLYQTALSPKKLVELTDLVASIGDKQIAYEVIVAKMMADPAIRLPSDSLMRNDPEAFLEETYNRFYVRKPSQAELNFFLNFLEGRPDVTPEHVYYSFALSNEYYYY
jgi:hypothetical protein